MIFKAQIGTAKIAASLVLGQKIEKIILQARGVNSA